MHTLTPLSPNISADVACLQDIPSRSQTLKKFTGYGILFGCLFPLFAWCFELCRFEYPLTLDNLKAIHNHTPVLYMIDTAPFFLGLFAFIAGTHKCATNNYHAQLQRLIIELEQLVSQRTNDLKVANTNLQQSYLEATAAAQAQGTFLANMSHEIRTPLNAVIGMATIAKKHVGMPDNAEKLEKSIDQIITSSRHLLGLINNILDLSKIRAGEFTLGEDNFSLHELISECCEMTLPRCMEKNIRLETNINTTESIWISADKLRIMQVLINLMGNSIKFTEPEGQITLEVNVQELPENIIQLAFAIQDTGSGMTQETITNLFQPFKQGSESSVRKSGGTGLGLAISQNIVQLLGSKIQVTSTIGQGSTFAFTIQVKKGTPEEYATVVLPPAGFLTNKRILLVDDVEVNRTIVEELLEDTGATIEMANDGDVAVDMFNNSSLHYYDLILMDVQMPTMNGHQASMAIRSFAREDAQTIPIIALTANAMKEDIQTALENGMNNHIVKPIELQNLLLVLNSYLGTPQ